MQARFESKHPHKTRVVVLEAESLEALQEAKTTFTTLYGWEVASERRPLGSTVPAQLVLRKPGTGLFGGWTEEEATGYVAQARHALAMLGITRVPHKRLTLHDLL